MVASTVQRTGEAARAVDDLAETLAIFDLKLRHMREAGLVSSGPAMEACSSHASKHPCSTSRPCSRPACVCVQWRLRRFAVCEGSRSWQHRCGYVAKGPERGRSCRRTSPP